MVTFHKIGDIRASLNPFSAIHPLQIDTADYYVNRFCVTKSCWPSVIAGKI